MNRIYHTAGRLDIAYSDIRRLCQLAKRLHRWHEHECNGTRGIDSPGNAYACNTVTGDRYRVPDTYTPAVNEVREIARDYTGMSITINDDPRGSTLAITYKGEEIRL